MEDDPQCAATSLFGFVAQSTAGVCDASVRVLRNTQRGNVCVCVGDSQHYDQEVELVYDHITTTTTMGQEGPV